MLGRHGRIDLLLCGGGHRADEQRDEREARRADGESQHQSSTGLPHGKQEVVAAVAAGGYAGQAAVVFDARRALRGHARRFEFAAACLGGQGLGRVLSRLEGVQLHERGRHFAAGDECGDLSLLERGPAGVGLPAELLIRIARRLKGCGGGGRGGVDGVAERRPLLGLVALPAVVLGRAVGQRHGERAVLGDHVLLGHGGRGPQAVAPIVGERGAVATEHFERIDEPGRVGVRKVRAPPEAGADELAGERPTGR